MLGGKPNLERKKAKDFFIKNDLTGLRGQLVARIKFPRPQN
jgi:hypothetical protein